MKPLVIIALAAAFVVPGAAQDAHLPQMPQGKDGNAAKLPAFLGVETGVIPEILREHLQLPADVGVIIQTLREESPAATAGLRVGDLITGMAGKPIKSSADLRERIRAQHAGDTVKIDVIQKGKPANLSVMLNQIPKDLVEPQAGNPDIQNLDARVNGMRQQLQQLQFQLGGAMPGIQGGINIQGGGEVRLSDGEGVIGFKSGDDGTEITVRDLQDKVIWSGPWDTEQDKAAAPDDIRRRIERLNIRQNNLGNGIQLRMGGNGIEIPDIQEDPENPPADEEEP